MAQLDNIKRILAEDFKKDDQETVEKLATILNYFMEQVHNAFDGRIDFSNLNQRLVTTEVTVNNAGTPIQGGTFSSTLTGASGSVVIAARNVSNASTYPTSMPFITFVPGASGTFKITHISGLQPGNKYKLTLILVGN